MTVGIEEPNSHRQDGRSAPWYRTSLARLLIFLLVGVALVVTTLRPALDRERGATGLRLELFPGSPGVTLGEKSLYPENDPWTAWLADEATCPRGEDRPRTAGRTGGCTALPRELRAHA